MASRPPAAADEDGRSPALSSVEFEQALRAATASHQSHGFGPRTGLIPDLRRALAGRVSRREFDQGLCRLRDEGSVDLEPHAHPEFLSPYEVQDALQEGQSLLYLLRWLR